MKATTVLVFLIVTICHSVFGGVPSWAKRDDDGTFYKYQTSLHELIFISCINNFRVSRYMVIFYRVIMPWYQWYMWGYWWLLFWNLQRRFRFERRFKDLSRNRYIIILLCFCPCLFKSSSMLIWKVNLIFLLKWTRVNTFVQWDIATGETM